MASPSSKSRTDYKYYFAFGSNLKRERHRCKGSKFYSVGELKNHKLAFFGRSSIWNGGVATVLPAPESEKESVWGAIWKVTPKDVEDLDIQEGVAIGVYNKRSEVDIHTPQHGVIQCLTYVKPPIDTPEDKPSLAYMNIIISGAREVGLPSDYIGKLESIQHNGQRAHSEELNKMAGLID